MRISDWSSDVCSSDLELERDTGAGGRLVEEVDHREPAERRHPRDAAVQHLAHAVCEVQHGLDLIEGEVVQVQDVRSEARREGKAGVRTCRARWTPYT